MKVMELARFGIDNLKLVDAEIKKLAVEEARVRTASGAIPEGAVDRDGHFYFMFEDKVTWKEAVARCEKLEGYLATVTSKDEYDLVTKVARRGNCWFGASPKRPGPLLSRISTTVSRNRRTLSVLRPITDSAGTSVSL